MLFSHIKYQYGQRNKAMNLVDQALAHFQYSLTFFPDLERGQDLQSIQAMVLILLQVRTFPKPGAAWYCSQLVMASAVEIGLNRSAAAMSTLDPREMTPHEVELRKRVFWTLYGIVVGLSGRLGRPIPLLLSDIDIEFPQPAHDYLPEEEAKFSEFFLCSFRVGISINTMLALFSELYSTFYAVSSCPHQNYDANVARLESDLQVWKRSVHPDIQDSLHTVGELRPMALYLELYSYEFEFLLHHPLILPPGETERSKEHLARCRELVPRTLATVSALRDAKCMDVPWYTVTTMLAMIFTTLYAEDSRGEEYTKSELQKLEAEMELWLSILGDIGTSLGE